MKFLFIEQVTRMEHVIGTPRRTHIHTQNDATSRPLICVSCVLSSNHKHPTRRHGFTFARALADITCVTESSANMHIGRIIYIRHTPLTRNRTIWCMYICCKYAYRTYISATKYEYLFAANALCIKWQHQHRQHVADIWTARDLAPEQGTLRTRCFALRDRKPNRAVLSHEANEVEMHTAKRHLLSRKAIAGAYIYGRCGRAGAKGVYFFARIRCCSLGGVHLGARRTSKRPMGERAQGVVCAANEAWNRYWFWFNWNYICKEWFIVDSILCDLTMSILSFHLNAILSWFVKTN